MTTRLLVGEIKRGREEDQGDDDRPRYTERSDTISIWRWFRSYFDATRKELAVTEEATRGDEITCEMVLSYIQDQLPSELPAPDRITVQQATPELFAVRIFWRDRDEEAFFVAFNDDAGV